MQLTTTIVEALRALRRSDEAHAHTHRQGIQGPYCTGEMPYTCDVRCERFSRSSVLTRHELGIDLLPHGTTTVGTYTLYDCVAAAFVTRAFLHAELHARRPALCAPRLEA